MSPYHWHCAPALCARTALSPPFCRRQNGPAQGQNGPRPRAHLLCLAGAGDAAVLRHAPQPLSLHDVCCCLSIPPSLRSQFILMSNPLPPTMGKACLFLPVLGRHGAFPPGLPYPAETEIKASPLLTCLLAGSPWLHKVGTAAARAKRPILTWQPRGERPRPTLRGARCRLCRQGD